MKKKTLDDFEASHGQEKLDDVKRKLEIEQAKVEQLAGVRKKITVQRSDSDVVKFGVMSDLHLGSLHHFPDALDAYYEILQEYGVDTIYCAGDVLEGHRVYKGQEFELRDVGLEAQLMRFASEVPRVEGIKVKFITGNHDTSFKKLNGAPIGPMIEGARSDWEFLGEDQAQVKLQTPSGSYSIRLLHPSGGTAYALSYHGQKIVESMAGGKKPNLLCLGHYHKAEFIPSYRNVAVLQTGTFQKQTPFMLQKGLYAAMGAWIVEVTVGKQYNRVDAEFIAFYE